MFRLIFVILFSIFLLTAFGSVSPVSALTINPPGEGYGINPSPETSTDVLVSKILSNVIVIIFSVSALIFIVMLVWGALEWVLSGGEKEKLQSAQKRITTAIVGFIILALVFLLARVIGTLIGFNPLQELRIPALGQGTETAPLSSGNPASSGGIPTQPTVPINPFN